MNAKAGRINCTRTDEGAAFCHNSASLQDYKFQSRNSEFVKKKNIK